MNAEHLPCCLNGKQRTIYSTITFQVHHAVGFTAPFDNQLANHLIIQLPQTGISY
jgi:hypothetical protein